MDPTNTWNKEHLYRYAQYQKDLKELQNSWDKLRKSVQPTTCKPKSKNAFNGLNKDWLDPCESYEEQQIYDKVK